MIDDFDKDLAARGIELHLSGATGPVRDMLYKCNLMTDPMFHHMSIIDAVNQIKMQSENTDVHERSLQTNVKMTKK